MTQTSQNQIDELLRRAQKAERKAGVLRRRAERLARASRMLTAPDFPEAPGEAHEPAAGPDYSYTQNRELSWLAFDARVLEEAEDPALPLLERLNYASIVASNLDEWVMIRVGTLSDKSRRGAEKVDNKSGLTPAEQLVDIEAALPTLVARLEAALGTIERELAAAGIERVTAATATQADLSYLAGYFEVSLAPYVSALVVNPRHPFPNLRNGRLEVVAELLDREAPAAEQHVLGVVEIPKDATRVVALPVHAEKYGEVEAGAVDEGAAAAGGAAAGAAGAATGAKAASANLAAGASELPAILRYILVEDVVRLFAQELFQTLTVQNTCCLRVTRNADLDPDRDLMRIEGDYRRHMKRVLKQRLRLQPIRLEIQGHLAGAARERIVRALKVDPGLVSTTSAPLDLSYTRALATALPKALVQALSFPTFEPQPTAALAPGATMREAVVEKDILLALPYESMTPLLDLLREASQDPTATSIRITLYRVAKQSRLCEALIAAAEAGKEVTVLLELRARFDESNNIVWAERLEAAGCCVMYGAQGFKCHSKVCQVTYHTPAGFMQVGVLATGNFNEATAKTYSDLVLLTAHAGINRDIDEFFKNLSLANLDGTYHYLGVAPHGLKPLILAGIERERKRAEAGEPARIVMKMNSLTDRDIIDALAISSQAGVEIDLIVRGICCLLPGVAGKTTGITVHSIVGRYLEHARLYTFGVGADLMYASSADMMTRNTERRVELAFPILDETCRQKVLSYLELELADNVKGRLLSPAGAWERIPVEPGEAAINAQEELMRAAGIAAATVATHRSHAPAAPGALGAPGSTAPQVNPQNELHRPLNASTSVAAEASMATASTSHVAPTTLPAPTPEKYHELPPSRALTPAPTGVALEGVGRLTGWARCVRAATLCLFGGTDAALKREAKREERARRKRGE